MNSSDRDTADLCSDVVLGLVPGPAYEIGVDVLAVPAVLGHLEEHTGLWHRNHIGVPKGEKTVLRRSGAGQIHFAPLVHYFRVVWHVLSSITSLCSNVTDRLWVHFNQTRKMS